MRDAGEVDDFARFVFFMRTGGLGRRSRAR